jgi:hypothetical protein
VDTAAHAGLHASIASRNARRSGQDALAGAGRARVMIYMSAVNVLPWCVMGDRQTVYLRYLTSTGDKQIHPLVLKKVSVPSRSFAAFDL